ncbi:PSD1 and planctomycete cytochrome C domain-containing protein [Stieleria varia]|nr:PSD1 and planctomycete cytochrome C domain-containing protein [Stieleria varia]
MNRCGLSLLVCAVLSLGAHAQDAAGPVNAPSSITGDSASNSTSSNTWIQDGFAQTRFVISGTGGRNNPLRRKVQPACSDTELFVRFRLRYDAQTIDLPSNSRDDSPGKGDGEFFVLWLDESPGTAGGTHSANVPNVGLHVSGEENRFMVRFQSARQQFGPVLMGDQDHLIVARLWKSVPGEQTAFDQLDLWVDPDPGAENAPQASTSTTKSIQTVRWIGFSTGAKTEVDDLIHVWDVNLHSNWRDALDLPPNAPPKAVTAVQPAIKTVSFGRDVLPILRDRCFECHSGSEPDSEIRLDVFDEVLNQTTPFDSTKSQLLQVVAAGKMPPAGPALPKPEIESLTRWIDEGLEWDEAMMPTPIPESDHWAFQSVQRPHIPELAETFRGNNAVDHFIAARQQLAGVTPNPPADATILARRISLDMLGLPPGVNTITADDIVDGTAVDKALSHPNYGLRWGRHWLDLARWAESNGHQHNRDRPHAWRYRDWVIDAFNQNMPFDQFLRAQIAGDLIRPTSDQNLIATGFLSAARYSGNELDKEIQRNDILVDVANVTASTFLGLTLQCAQCHTHKFDPLTIRDYYRFQAFFGNGQPHNVAMTDQNESVGALVQERWQIYDAVHDRLVSVKRKQGHPEPIYVIPKSVIGGMKPDERASFDELEQQFAKLPQTWAFVQPREEPPGWPIIPHEMRWPLPRNPDALRSRQTHLLLRGDVQAVGPAVESGWPYLFPQKQPSDKLTRLDLADWMTDPTNPLTARVWVNRIWQWHFGVGLVESVSDFGTQGTPPTHPELLDYLAAELIDNDWDSAHIHRLILGSATYRQSHMHSAANAQIDPDNRLGWRWQPRRLEAEAIRDSILDVSGRLDAAIGGPSTTDDSSRYSVYLRQKRDQLPTHQVLFDGASGITSCARRRVSTNALQPLWLMNHDFVQQAARELAEKSGTVTNAFQTALGRPPSASELTPLNRLADQHGLASACLVILNSSEFVYIP